MLQRFFKERRCKTVKDYGSAVANAARAVKIELKPDEQEQLTEELAAFEQWLEPLLAVDTAQTEPLLHSHGAVNVLREDEPAAGDREKLQQAAASFSEGFYRVPAIIE
jgi:aspartyl/glutamyl-tRNA(Asn/Gln) amidotransferase C subunit